jgi:dienelactone hydrolase
MIYEEPIEASEPLRVEQAEELLNYLDAGRSDSTRLSSLFAPDYSSDAAYAESTLPLRDELLRAIGYPPPGEPTDSEAEFRILADDDLATYFRVRVPVFHDLHLRGLFLVPKKAELPAPLVISCHGGGGSPELATFNGGTNYHDMVRGAVEQGYVVWAPQLLFHASGQVPNLRHFADSKAREIGTSITAIEIHKIRRSIDHLIQRPEVIPDRVGMVGLSYGGYFTLYTSALEPRIRAAVSSCYFNDRASIFDTGAPYGFNDWRFMNSVTYFQDPEIAALVCPRPLQIQVGIDDDLFPVAGARRAVVRAQQYYEKLGRGEQFEYREFSGGHEFCGAEAWRFLKAWL